MTKTIETTTISFELTLEEIQLLHKLLGQLSHHNMTSFGLAELEADKLQSWWEDINGTLKDLQVKGKI